MSTNPDIVGAHPLHRVLVYPLVCNAKDSTSIPLLRMLLISLFMEHKPASATALAAQLCVGERTIYRGLSALRKMGLVHAERKGDALQYVVDPKVYA